MDKKVLIFLPFADQKNFREDEHPDFVITQLSTSAVMDDMGKVYNYQTIPRKNVKEFIRKKVDEFGPDWIIAEGNSATAILELKLPNSILINPKVTAESLLNVSEKVRENSFGYFGMDHEKDYELFRSVFPNVGWYPHTEIHILRLKSTLEAIISSDEDW